jgi:hypothetical protein
LQEKEETIVVASSKRRLITGHADPSIAERVVT